MENDGDILQRTGLHLCSSVRVGGECQPLFPSVTLSPCRTSASFRLFPGGAKSPLKDVHMSLLDINAGNMG